MSSSAGNTLALFAIVLVLAGVTAAAIVLGLIAVAWEIVLIGASGLE